MKLATEMVNDRRHSHKTRSQRQNRRSTSNCTKDTRWDRIYYQVYSLVLYWCSHCLRLSNSQSCLWQWNKGIWKKGVLPKTDFFTRWPRGCSLTQESKTVHMQTPKTMNQIQHSNNPGRNKGYQIFTDRLFQKAVNPDPPIQKKLNWYRQAIIYQAEMCSSKSIPTVQRSW